VLELWHEWNSVHSFKVRLVLAEKRLPWVDHRLELLKFEHLRRDYLQLNPNGVVPTLVHDGEPVFESSIICQYLDEAFSEVPLLPPGALQRARALAWLKYFDDRVHAPIRRASFELLYRPELANIDRSLLEQRLLAHPDQRRARSFLDAAAGPPDQCAVAEATAAFIAVIADLEHGLRSGDWLSGSAFGMADVGMAAFAERLDVLGMGHLWKVHTRARDWSLRIMKRPSVLYARAPANYRLSRER
jgi:glutathione S-transferase